MYSESATLQNATDHPVTVSIEPWGSIYVLAAHRTWSLEVQSSEAGALELVREHGRLTVYAWPGCTARLVEEDLLIDELTIAVPSIPPSASIRSFIDGLFGRPSQR